MVDADNYKIEIKDLALFVRNVQLSPAVRMGHVKAFEKTSSSVVFPSSVHTCFGPSMLSGT
jgi:hypothetical protein